MRTPPPRARAPARRTARRARRSRGTGRGSRTPATAARRRRWRAIAIARATARVERADGLDRAPASRRAPRAIAGASRPISSTARHARRRRRLERREALALAVAAGDQHDRPADALERDLRRRDRRALRIVDEQHAAASAIALHPVRQAAKRRERLEHRPLDAARPRDAARARRARSARCGGRRATAMPRGTQQLAAAREPRSPSRASTRPHSSSDSGTPAPNVCSVSPGRRIEPHDGIVAVQDLHASRARRCAPSRPRSRRCRHSGPCGSPVTLSTVAATGFEARRRLELVARQLEHEHVGPRRARLDRRQRVERPASPMLPATTVASPAARVSAPVSAVDRRLAVGAGDREHLLRGRQRAREELDVADELGAARDRGARSPAGPSARPG